MERHFDEELNELYTYLLKMASMVQEAISHSIESLKNNDRKMAEDLIISDTKIDELEIIIDDKCIDLIARYQPVAKDLRFIATAMKINAELERIADLAVDIAQRVLELVDKPLLKPLIDIPKLSIIAQRMVSDSIEAFIKRDTELAKKVLASDSEADKLRNDIADELVRDYMSVDPKTVDRGIPLLLIARHLERICDHTTNIAEDVIYMVEGKIVKHKHLY